MPYIAHTEGREPPLSQTDPISYTRAVMRNAGIGPNALVEEIIRLQGHSTGPGHVNYCLAHPARVSEKRRALLRQAMHNLGYRGNADLLFCVPPEGYEEVFPQYTPEEREQKREELLTWIRTRYLSYGRFLTKAHLPHSFFGVLKSSGWKTSETSRAVLILFLQKEGCPVEWVRSLIDIADGRGHQHIHWRKRRAMEAAKKAG